MKKNISFIIGFMAFSLFCASASAAQDKSQDKQASNQTAVNPVTNKKVRLSPSMQRIVGQVQRGEISAQSGSIQSTGAACAPLLK